MYNIHSAPDTALEQPEDTEGIVPDFDLEIITGKGIAADAAKLIEQAEAQHREITGTELLQMPAERIPCLVEPFLQQVGIACLAGTSDAGKSTFLRQLAVSVVTGTDFLGFKINARHKSALFVSTEDGKEATAWLLKQQAKELKPEQLAGLRFLFEPEGLEAELERRLRASPADLVIVDCFADAFAGDLKDTQRIRSYLHPFQSLAERHKCLILFLHHTAKRTEHLEPNKNNLLSGQGFEGKMRLVMELRPDNLNPAQRHLCIVKGNYLPANCKRESFVLHFDESNFSFTNTGERMPFELLAKQVAEDSQSRAKYDKAKELKAEGKTHQLIADALGYSSKGSVTKLFDKGQKQGWDK